MKKEPKRWLSPAKECDICHGPLGNQVDYFVDGKTIYGSAWGLMCPKCFKKVGVGLGCGKGQKYDGKTKELLEGGCEDSE